jgi:hypothetical protein
MIQDLTLRMTVHLQKRLLKRAGSRLGLKNLTKFRYFLKYYSRFFIEISFNN